LSPEFLTTAATKNAEPEPWALRFDEMLVASYRRMEDNCRPISAMKKENTKSKTTETQLLELLQKVLPKATHDPQLAGQIYQAVEQELKRKAKASAFDKFCRLAALPDLEPKTVKAVKDQLAESFGGGDVTLKPNRKEQNVAVEVVLGDGTQFSSQIQVKPAALEESAEQEVELKFVPFPVSLPGDQELVWMLAKRENMTPEEAGIALAKVEEDFWASKPGQKMIRDRVERCFPEFIARAPSGLLNEVGLKRHYKMPEPIKVLHPAPAKRPPRGTE
jgi:hypothetical protein